MKVYCVQTDIIWEDKIANMRRVMNLLKDASVFAGSLVVLPEMFATGFSMDVEKVTDDVDHEIAKFLSDLAHLYRVTIMAGIVSIGPDGKGQNQAVIVNPDGSELTRYHKIHPFTFGEATCYSAGSEVKVLPLNDFQFAPFVCYDLRFPEIFRVAAKRGANLMAVIANWPVARIEHWVTLLKARAIENQCYIVGVNRVGDDPSLHHTGRSMIVAPSGDFVLDCGEGEGVYSADIDIEVVNEIRERLPFLADMRKEFVQ